MQETRAQSPGREDPPGEGSGSLLLQDSCLENSVGRGASELQSLGLQTVGYD